MNKDEEKKINRALIVGELGDHAEKLFNRRLSETFASYGIETNTLFYHKLVSHGIALRLLVEHLGSYDPSGMDDDSVKAYIEKMDEDFAMHSEEDLDQRIEALAEKGVTVNDNIAFDGGKNI